MLHKQNFEEDTENEFMQIKKVYAKSAINVLYLPFIVLVPDKSADSIDECFFDST